MTTQFSPILKLALPVQGELSGTWGTVVNDNITSMVEQAIAGRAVVNTWTGNSHTLTTANGTTSESRCAMLSLTDTTSDLTGAGTVVCPAASKIYIVKNATGQNITVKTASGSGILIPNGRTTFLFCDGTNVLEALTHTTSLQLGTSTTVTAVLDEDNMSSNSATSLATQQSIKAYVDSQVGTSDTLAEVLANGNATGSNNILVDGGQKITVNTIDEATAGSGVTIDSVLLKDDTVNATDIETASISANNGTTAATIANSTGVVTVPSSVLTTTDINGGTADGVVIGGATPAAATVTTLVANTNLTINSTVTVTSILDEDNMSSNDPVGLATQQSIKAYVDSQSSAGGFSYVAKTANFTVSNLQGVLANTSGGVFTVTLPASPTLGDQVIIADAGGAFGTNNCIAGRNGSTIEGASSDLNLNIDGVSVQFVYSGTTWEVYAQVGGNGGDAVTLTGTQTLTNKTLTAPVLTTPALGTPASGVMTSVTGLPLTTGVTGTLPVANGGTGATSLTANNVVLGNGTSAVQVVAPSTSGNVLTSNGTTWASTAPVATSTTLTPVVYTATQNFTVPAGVTSVRAYAVGGGGDGGVPPAGNYYNTSGAGGGMAYGDIAVSPGDTINMVISSKVATVAKSGTTLLTGNPGANAANGTLSSAAAGTAVKHSSVTNGNAYSGGAGSSMNATSGPGGAGAGSPLGVGCAGGAKDGAGGIGNTSWNSYSGGGAGSGSTGGGTDYVSGGTAPNQKGRDNVIYPYFTDPLIAGCTQPGERANVSQTGWYYGYLHYTPTGVGGEFDNRAAARSHGNAGSFGGGAGSPSGTGSASVNAGSGGMLCGGGGAGVNSGGSCAAGNGGYGGGGGGASNQNGSATRGQGGAACIVLIY